jgi:exonuclease III
MRKDGLNGYRGVMISIKNGTKFKKTLELGTDSCELVGAEIAIDHGQKVKIFSLYCVPSWGLNSQEVGDALAVVSHPMLVLVDFNIHSQSWVVTQKTVSARAVQSMFDGLDLGHLNDGTLTRIAAPPRISSAIDLILCTAGLALKAYEWTVLENAGSSDHLPILKSF